MATKTKKYGIRDIFSAIFLSNDEEIIDDENDEKVKAKLPKELQDKLSAISEKEKDVEKGFNVASNKVGLDKINPNTLKAMRGKRNEVVAGKKQEEKTVEYEIGD